MRFNRSRSSKVIDFNTNRKRVCDFLLVRHSNLGPGTVSEILQVFVLMTPLIFHSNFGVFLLDQIADVGVSPNIKLKLISREIIFDVRDHGTGT